MLILIQATPEDIDIVTGYSNAMNIEDGHPASPNNKKALLELMSNKDLGDVFLIQINHQTIGYLAMFYSYSIEFGGRDIVLDELYINPQFRNKGYGSTAIQAFIERYNNGRFVAIHIEAMIGGKPEKLYENLGFKGKNSHILTYKYS